MPIIRLPSVHDTSYLPARGPVLLLSCMDLRFIDEIVQFMDHDGLNNRYDHVIMAGAALGALGELVPERKKYEHWRLTFLDHLAAAVKLHHIKDVYILEHRDCGAYHEFLGDAGRFEDHEAEEEANRHRDYAEQLRAVIFDWANKEDVKLRVYLFLMERRGHVTPLAGPVASWESTPIEGSESKPKRKTKAARKTSESRD